MDDAGFVRGLEGIGDLRGDRHDFGESHRATRDGDRQVVPLDQLHDERAESVLSGACRRAASSMPKMAAMFGWLSVASVWASRVNRASRSESCANASGSTLIATSRLSRASRAR